MSDRVLPSTYIIGILVFMLVVGSGIGMITTFMDHDSDFGMNQTDMANFNRTFYVLDEVADTVDDLETGVVNASTDFGAFGVLNSLISGGWQTLKLLTSSLSFMNSVFSGLATFFGIPGFVINIIIFIITVFILFAIYSAIFQRDI